MLMKETDLIYEGIATESVIVDIEMVEEKETDLIYEGIATFSSSFYLSNPYPTKKLT